jgi:hypothetical protein
MNASAAVKRANAVCSRDDAVIKAAEAPGVIFTAAAVDAIDREVTALERLPLERQLRPAYAEWAKARSQLLSGFAGIRTVDAHLLAAKHIAAAHGIRCSFGALPLRGLP